MTVKIAGHHLNGVSVVSDQELPVLGIRMRQTKTHQPRPGLGKCQVLDQIPLFVSLQQLNKLIGIGAACLRVQEILQHGVVQHRESCLLLLHQMVDHVMQKAHRRRSLLRVLLENLRQFCRPLCILVLEQHKLRPIPFPKERGFLLLGRDHPVDIIENPRRLRVTNKPLNMSIELGDDQIPNLGIPVHNQLSN